MIIRQPIQSPIHRARQHLQNPFPRDRLAVFSSDTRQPNIRRIIHHIADPVQAGQRIVQLLQGLARALLVANLEELDPNLTQRRIQLIQASRSRHNHALRIIRGLAVRQHDDVQRLRVRCYSAGVSRRSVQVEVGAQNAVEARRDRRDPSGPHEVEQPPDFVGGTHVARRVLRRVEEVHVDAVGVVFGRDSGDGLECCAGVAPPREGVHAGGVVDDEDGVEGAEEVVLVFAQRALRAAGLRRQRWCGRGGVAASDLDGLWLGAEFSAADARVEGRAVPVQQGVVVRRADGHLGHGVCDVLFAIARLGRGYGVRRGCAAGEAVEARMRVCAAGLVERGRRGWGCGDHGSAGCYRGVSTCRAEHAGEKHAPLLPRR